MHEQQLSALSGYDLVSNCSYAINIISISYSRLSYMSKPIHCIHNYYS